LHSSRGIGFPADEAFPIIGKDADATKEMSIEACGRNISALWMEILNS
jgi:hypothetical protein